MEIINKHLIDSIKNIETKDDLFKHIVNLVEKQNLTRNASLLLNDIVSREVEGSTAFENGLMIPHCRSKYIDKITLAIVDFNDIDFNSIDGSLTNFAVAILVPEIEEKKHLQILSKISSLLSNKEKLLAFKKLSKEEKITAINDQINKESNIEEVKSDDGYDFVAITSCAAGIAHTYMARDALKEAANKLNLKCKIETRGAMTENTLSAMDIDKAKFVIIAADTTISRTPFLGKKLHIVSTNAAIKNPASVIETAKDIKIDYGKGQKLGKITFGTTDKSKQKVFSKALMSALGYMIPVAVAGGLLMAIPNAIAATATASETGKWGDGEPAFFKALGGFGGYALTFMPVILAMFLAFNLGGKPAIPAAFLGTLLIINTGSVLTDNSPLSFMLKNYKDIANSVTSGFLGGLLIGIFVGYLVKYMRWIKWHRFVKPISGLMIIPLLSSFITFLLVFYVVGVPITYVMVQLFRGLSILNGASIWASIGIGMLFAGLMAVDLGGPINKTALTTATVIYTTTLGTANIDHTIHPELINFVPQTAVQAAISVPPLGMWLSTILFKKKFSITEKTAGGAALPMGLVGVTEGALPFAFRTPLRAMVANISGAVVAGGIVSAARLQFWGGLGSPTAVVFGFITHSGIPYDAWVLVWIVGTLLGATVTGVLYGLLRKRNPEFEKEYEEEKTKKAKALELKGIHTKKDLAKYRWNNFKTNFWLKTKYMVNPKHWIEKPSDWNQDTIEDAQIIEVPKEEKKVIAKEEVIETDTEVKLEPLENQ